MNIEIISELHLQLNQQIKLNELDAKALLSRLTSLLTQYRQAKAIIRKLDCNDGPAELKHWTEIRDFTYNNIDNVISELNQRAFNPEEFTPAVAIKFADTVAKVRASCWQEIYKDRNSKDDDDGNLDVVLILE